MRSKMQGEIATGMIALLIVIFLGLAWEFGAGILASESSAVRAAEVQGFTNIRVTDKAIIFLSWRGCGSGDAARFSIEAKNAEGKNVNFYVCTGFWKGSTIRTK